MNTVDDDFDDFVRGQLAPLTGIGRLRLPGNNQLWTQAHTEQLASELRG